MTIIYGIKNCDTVKKAKKWLDDNNVNYQFHDFRVDGLSSELLNELFQQLDWQLLLNKRSTTFRNLSDDIKNNLSKEVAFEQILAQPTLLKRPVVVTNDKTDVGFKAPQYQELFNL